MKTGYCRCSANCCNIETFTSGKTHGLPRQNLKNFMHVNMGSCRWKLYYQNCECYLSTEKNVACFGVKTSRNATIFLRLLLLKCETSFSWPSDSWTNMYSQFPRRRFHNARIVVACTAECFAPRDKFPIKEYGLGGGGANILGNIAPHSKNPHLPYLNVGSIFVFRNIWTCKSITDSVRDMIKFNLLLHNNLVIHLYDFMFYALLNFGRIQDKTLSFSRHWLLLLCGRPWSHVLWWT